MVFHTIPDMRKLTIIAVCPLDENMKPKDLVEVRPEGFIASSNEPGQEPDNLMDIDEENVWSPKSESLERPWVEAVFDSPVHPISLTVVAYTDADGEVHNMPSYSIEVSEDGETFERLKNPEIASPDAEELSIPKEELPFVEPQLDEVIEFFP